MSTAPGPAAPSPQPTKGRRSSLLWWIAGLALAGVVVIGLGGVLAALFLARHIEVTEGGSGVEVTTPIGSVRAGKSDGVSTGLPEYPGARLDQPAAEVELSPPDEEAVSIVAARYRTPHALPTVDTWYRENLGTEFTREGPGISVRKQRLFGTEVRSTDTVYVAEEDNRIRFVVLRRNGTETEIVLARLGKQELQ